jgi:hypothetical protein
MPVSRTTTVSPCPLMPANRGSVRNWSRWISEASCRVRGRTVVASAASTACAATVAGGSAISAADVFDSLRPSRAAMVAFPEASILRVRTAQGSFYEFGLRRAYGAATRSDLTKTATRRRHSTVARTVRKPKLGRKVARLRYRTARGGPRARSSPRFRWPKSPRTMPAWLRSAPGRYLIRTSNRSSRLPRRS